MIYVRRQRFGRLSSSVSRVTNLLARVGGVLLLITVGLLAVLLISYHQLPSHLLLKDQFQELQEWLQEKERINEHIVKVCEKYGKTARLRHPDVRFLYKSHLKGNLLNCVNAKVACTTWLAEFALLDNKTLDNSNTRTRNRERLAAYFRLHGTNHSYTMDLVTSKLSFSTVRDPFERLI